MQVVDDLKWYVAYTYPKAERKAYRKADEMGVEAFLPMQKVVRQWSDRKKRIEMPVFPNYVFIRTTSHKRFQVLAIKELVRYVSFGGKPVEVPETEIESIRRILSSDTEVSNESFCKNGTLVRITSGTFAGATGILLRKKGKRKLVVQIEALRQAISVDLWANCVEEIC